MTEFWALYQRAGNPQNSSTTGVTLVRIDELDPNENHSWVAEVGERLAKLKRAPVYLAGPRADPYFPSVWVYRGTDVRIREIPHGSFNR
jgi:hypothetical protein